MVTLIVVFSFFCVYLFSKGEDFFLIKQGMAMEGFEDDNSEENEYRAFRKKLDKYWKYAQICGVGCIVSIVVAVSLFAFEIFLIFVLFTFRPASLEKKIETYKIENAALEDSIVEILVENTEFNDDAFKIEDIDLENSFDYVLIYLMKHPELREDNEFYQQFSLYQKNYCRIQTLESKIERHRKIRYMLYFGGS